MKLRIGEFSRRGRVSVKALRHYEAIGLLKPDHVDATTGYRYYAATQLDDLHRLMVLRALGLPLQRIREVLRDDPTPERMRRLLDERRAAVARRIDAEQAQLAAIEARIRHLEGEREAGCGAVVRDVPAALVASLRRVVPDYGTVELLFDEITRTLPEPLASPAMARSGTTARRTSGRSIAKRWCCSSGPSRRGAASGSINCRPAVRPVWSIPATKRTLPRPAPRRGPPSPTSRSR